MLVTCRGRFSTSSLIFLGTLLGNKSVSCEDGVRNLGQNPEPCVVICAGFYRNNYKLCYSVQHIWIGLSTTELLLAIYRLYCAQPGLV